MEYSGFASRLDAAIYRSDIKVREHLSQCGMDTETLGRQICSMPLLAERRCSFSS